MTFDRGDSKFNELGTGTEVYEESGKESLFEFMTTKTTAVRRIAADSRIDRINAPTELDRDFSNAPSQSELSQRFRIKKRKKRKQKGGMQLLIDIIIISIKLLVAKATSTNPVVHGLHIAIVNPLQTSSQQTENQRPLELLAPLDLGSLGR